ncbi:MAG TPA: hypothetical protein DG761_05215 [Gammaproteobacteria bacterium]|nr:hypothetical protein [Gammaproteobacteria bacterium]
MEGKEPRDIADAAARALLSPMATDDHYTQLVQSIEMLHKESYIKTLESSIPYDRQLALESIKVPSLFLFGQHDPLCPPKFGRSMADRVRRSRFFEIANAGHLVNIEQPEVFNQIVLDFLFHVEKSKPQAQN